MNTSQDESSLTANARRTLALYRELRKQRDIARAERERRAAEGEPEPAVPDGEVIRRVRATETKDGGLAVDLAKAADDCVHCGGSGLRGEQVVNSEETGETLRIPVICRCVKRNGGIADDLLDHATEAQARKGRIRWDERRKRRRARKRKRKKKHNRR